MRPPGKQTSPAWSASLAVRWAQSAAAWHGREISCDNAWPSAVSRRRRLFLVFLVTTVLTTVVSGLLFYALHNRQADESIAVDAGFMLEAVFDAHVDLRRQIVATGVDGGADHGREQRIDQSLAAHDDEDSGPLRASPPWVPDAEEVAALQTSA